MGRNRRWCPWSFWGYLIGWMVGCRRSWRVVWWCRWTVGIYRRGRRVTRNRIWCAIIGQRRKNVVKIRQIVQVRLQTAPVCKALRAIESVAIRWRRVTGPTQPLRKQRTLQQRLRLDVAASEGVVIAIPVFEQVTLDVMVLTRKTQIRKKGIRDSLLVSPVFKRLGHHTGPLCPVAIADEINIDEFRRLAGFQCQPACPLRP